MRLDWNLDHYYCSHLLLNDILRNFSENGLTKKQILDHLIEKREGLLEKSKLAQHAYEEHHKVIWDQARVLEVESNNRFRKYKESAHMACSTNPISQPSLDISPIWIPLISDEVTKSKRKSIP
jgi:hypothetical protein